MPNQNEEVGCEIDDKIVPKSTLSNAWKNLNNLYNLIDTTKIKIKPNKTRIASIELLTTQYDKGKQFTSF